MQTVVFHLEKRKIFIMKLLFLFASLALLFNYFFTIIPPQYFDGKYNMYFVYGLIVYKIVELFIIYYILMHRHILFLRKNSLTETLIKKLQKHSKLLLFLVIQGNTVFGIIAFKFSGNVLFFLLFSCIAFITLLLIKPNKLLESLNN